jgi:hypothetical protein
MDDMPGSAVDLANQDKVRSQPHQIEQKNKNDVAIKFDGHFPFVRLYSSFAN